MYLAVCILYFVSWLNECCQDRAICNWSTDINLFPVSDQMRDLFHKLIQFTWFEKQHFDIWQCKIASWSIVVIINKVLHSISDRWLMFWCLVILIIYFTESGWDYEGRYDKKSGSPSYHTGWYHVSYDRCHSLKNLIFFSF